MPQCYGNKLKKTQNSTEKACFGTILPEEKHNDFGAEQIGQLQELMQEATKPNSQFSITDSMKPKIQSITIKLNKAFKVQKNYYAQ